VWYREKTVNQKPELEWHCRSGDDVPDGVPLPKIRQVYRIVVPKLRFMSSRDVRTLCWLPKLGPSDSGAVGGGSSQTQGGGNVRHSFFNGIRIWHLHQRMGGTTAARSITQA
jgi:hypothetical protein